ncbi:hypothetical protein AB0D57_28510 [Streptomyces sp. NPDC048275]|uniref:hypothetical protein n=1 Tax=Streptomyces sp. NPDC048275 TaxID=3155629 RepID=UPI0033C69F4F
MIWPDRAFDTHRVQPLVRKTDGETIRITPGEALEKAPTVPDSTSKSGRGGKLGKLLGGLGLLGDVYLVWDATRSWQRGYDGWVVSCDPAPTA